MPTKMINYICSKCGFKNDKCYHKSMCMDKMCHTFVYDENDLTESQVIALDKIKNFSNKDLLENTIFSAAGDDYDGCFTDFGSWEFDVLQRELNERLGGWLNE